LLAGRWTSVEPSRMPHKHTMPQFLGPHVTPLAYEHWLERKARAVRTRDRKRGRKSTRAQLKEAIHAAVLASEGRDAYTGEELDWKLISTYRNEDARAGRYEHKARFALLPTVDHARPGDTEADFKICGWRTNDAKNDLPHDAFIELCIRVLEHAGFSIEGAP